MEKISKLAYRRVFRKTSTFAAAIGIGAIFLDRAVDVAAETIWEKNNEGKLWKDVKKQLNLEVPK